MFDLNVCKSSQCSNLGVEKSPDYEYDSTVLGFKAVHCNNCGANPPMLDNESFNLIAHYWLNRIGANTGKWCPDCYSTNIKMFGYSPTGSKRKRCNNCGKTFTGLNYSSTSLDRIKILRKWTTSHLLTKPENSLQLSTVQTDRIFHSLESLCLNNIHSQPIAKDVATTYFKVPYKGQDNYLWLIISFDIHTGKIIHITSTLVPLNLPNQGKYNWNEKPQDEVTQNNQYRALEKAELKEQSFLNRTQFDRISYGQTQLNTKNNSVALPVLIAHCHFLVLAKLGHGRSIHILDHEIFFRGACITQNAKYIKSEGTSLFYVVGSCDPKAKLARKRHLGWWKNLWYEYEDDAQNTLGICKICGTNKLNFGIINPIPVLSFKEKITQRFEQLRTMTAKRMLSLVLIYADEHNVTHHDKE